MNDIIFHERDPFSPVSYSYTISSVLHSSRSNYQEIQVLESPYFGKMLVLDGVVQLTEKDEFFYHEMLAHVVLHAHLEPEVVLIIGGGDGGTLREVLKHKSVKRVQLIELDKDVIDISKRYFPSLSEGFADARVQVKEMNGSHFVKETEDKFDIVIIDSTDPVGSAEVLFSEEFFNDIYTILKESGMMVVQTESLHFHRDFISDIQKMLGKIFNITGLYTVPLATYAGNWWTFSIASKKYAPFRQVRKQIVPTKYYDAQIHANAFLPDRLYKKILYGKTEW